MNIFREEPKKLGCSRFYRLSKLREAGFVGSNPTLCTNEEPPEVSKLVTVGIRILQRGNREASIEQFVFVEVSLFFQNASVV